MFVCECIYIYTRAHTLFGNRKAGINPVNALNHETEGFISGSHFKLVTSYNQLLEIFLIKSKLL